MSGPGPSGHVYPRRGEEADKMSKSRQKKRKMIVEGSEESDIEYLDETGSTYDDFEFDNSETTIDEDTDESDIELEELGLFEDDGTSEWSCDGDLLKFPFEGKVGLQCTPNGWGPYFFFELLFDNYFFLMIVMETNRYAEQKTGNQWNELTVPEFRTFMGLLLHMGTVKCPKLECYWSTDRLFDLQCFSLHMSITRFHDILRFLHFSSMNGSGNPLAKIQPIVDYFNDKIMQIYYPHKELVVNEILFPRRDRSVFRRYSTEKKRNRGVKLYVLTEGSGVAVRMETATGSEEGDQDKDRIASVVLRLVDDFLNKGHSLFVDEFCASFTLCKHLLEARTYCTGILRRLRKGNDEDVIKAKLVKGKAIARHKNNVMMGKFKGEREVLFLSSEYPVDYIELENKRKEKFYKPLALHKYKEFMSSIEKRNRMLSCYTCSRRTYKWYVQLWINAVEILLLNAFFLYSRYSPLATKLDFHKFRLNVIDSLLYENHRESINIGVSDSEHLPDMLPRGINNRVRRKRCRQCFANSVRKETNYFCSGCRDQPGLCLGKCFREYHKRM